MVVGLRQINRPTGLFALSAIGSTHDFGEQFGITYFDRNGTHYAGCVLTFRTMRFGIHFEERQLSSEMFWGQPGLQGTSTLQPFNALLSGSTNVELRLEW